MKEEFRQIIESEDLKHISSDIVEIAVDREISNELIKEIPILKTIQSIRNIYSSLSDRIFIKKALTVLIEIGDINWKQRVELNRALDDEDDNGAEKILMAIDKLETTKKCKIFGKLCKLKALDKINREDFLRLTKLIQDAYLDDLKLLPVFNELKSEHKEIHEMEFVPLISLGIIFQAAGEQEPIRRAQQYHDGDPEFEGGGIHMEYFLSDLGHLVNQYYVELAFK